MHPVTWLEFNLKLKLAGFKCWFHRHPKTARMTYSTGHQFCRLCHDFVK